ncbi:MAG TPA: asparaginase, partial [Candidatus Thermoplasmatota archaeon]|nr:asparaginase [Candidatus Thermoplasmatota archaeon]
LVASGAAEAFSLTDAELALACGSHSGEPRHVAVAAGMLQKAGAGPELLQCGTHAPRSRLAKDALGGGRTTPLHHNCSGKHAGMMVLQRHLGADPADYWKPDAPCQKLVLDALREASGHDAIATGTDGCSVPNFAMPVRNAALLFARLAMPQGLPPATTRALERLRGAMLRHPELVGGSESFDTDLMGAADDRLVAKAGAEGCEGVGDLRTGMGLFLKVEDGAGRAVPPATVEALRQLAWMEGRAFEVLGEWWMPMLKNWAGRDVGRLKPVLQVA